MSELELSIKRVLDDNRIHMRVTKKLDKTLLKSLHDGICVGCVGLDSMEVGSPPVIKDGPPRLDFGQHNKHTYSSKYWTVPSSMKYQKHPISLPYRSRYL